VKDVLLDRGNPPSAMLPPSNPPAGPDIIWVYDMMDELACSRTTRRTAPSSSWTTSFTPAPRTPGLDALEHSVAERAEFHRARQKDGKFLAEDDAKIGPHIFHGQWGSATLAEVNGKKQIVFGAATAGATRSMRSRKIPATKAN